MRTALGALGLWLVGLGASAVAAPLARGPYVQDVRDDGFTIVCDSAAPATVELRAGDGRAVSRGTHHELVVRGLPPAARVRYRLSVDGAAAGGGQVALPDATRPVTFVVYGDTRNGEAVAAPLLAQARSLAPAFILFTGDIAVDGANADAWQDFFAGEAPLLADVPLYPALGNHELFHDRDASRFRQSFALPDDGRQRLYYSFRWGALRFVVLDGNAPGAAQTEWLRAQLEAAERERAAHVFVLVHQPPLSVGAHCGAGPAEAEWVRLFERYRVRAVFAGHDHAYERMERNGVRYFVSGGGGAPLYDEVPCAAADEAARRVYVPAYHLLRVRVDGPAVEVAALPLDDGPPLDLQRFVAGEPMFAAEAPLLAPAPPQSRHGWALAAATLLLVVIVLLARRRRGRRYA